MSTINYLTVRNTVLPVVNATRMNYSTLTGSTITATSMNLTSASVALGASTNQTYTNFSNGSYAPPWITAKDALSSTNKTVMSANGLYQMIVGNTTSGLFLSSDSGITWTALTGGLPTLTGSAYWSDGSISANGQYITLSIYGGSLWMSADYGRTFALTNQPTPSIWLPLNGNTTDLMGSSTVTTPGTVPGYVTLNYPGYTAQAVNLANTAGGTATRYIRGTWTGATNFTVSLWFNAQAVNGTLQPIFEANYSGFGIFINTNNVLYFQFPNGGASGNTQLQTSFTLSVNTWYYVTGIFQTNGLCSFYVNNTLIASSTNTGGVGAIPSSGFFGVGTFDTVTTNAFNGYVDDLRITNSVSPYVPIPLLQPNIWLPFENTAADLGSHSLPPGATPTIYLPFEGNTTDSMGASTVTATGAVTYPTGYIGQAIRLTNPAGGTAAQFVRGNWTSPSIYTVSGWFNLQTSTGTGNQFIFSTGGTSGPNAVILYINTNTQLAAQVPNGVTIVAPVTISLNTWYSFSLKVYPSGGQCSLYLNNSIYTAAATATATPSGVFGLGTFDSGTATNAFNGLIDDFRITNLDVPLSVISVTGSLSYVPGVVGLNAVNLVNTAGGSATNYIKGACSPMGSDMTVSCWFNVQSFSTNGFQIIFEMYSNSIEFYIDDANRRVNGRITLGLTFTDISVPISLNTWYHVCIIFRVNGACSFHFNGTLIQTVTNTAGYGTRPSTSLFSLGTYATLSNLNAFNGYIDDLRIYNAAIPYHVLFPQNYRSLALSGTGQYALASAASGWVVGSSNSSQTWSKQAVCVGTQSDFIQPNITGLGANTWTANGVTWTASANAANLPAYNAFNNNFSTGNNWLGQLGPGQYNASGVYTGTASTTIIGIGSIGGEWVQIQSSVPLILSNYSYAVGGKFNQPKTMYIVGSADGLTNWQPLQLHVLAANPFTTDFTAASTFIIMNLTGTQTVTAQTSQTVTTTAYASTTQAFTYFRFIINTNFLTSVDCGALGELYLNFVRPLTSSRPSASLLSLNHTGQYQLVATGPAAGSIMPNLTGLAASTWTQSGVNWGVNASSSLFAIYTIFDTTIGNRWVPLSNTYSTAGNSSGVSNTILGGIGAVTGEWLQIQSSVPLVMSSYQFATGPVVARLPKTYYITGSNDGSNWYPIQFGSGGAVTTTAVNTLVPGVILINSTSTQTFGSSTVATTAYSTSTNAYTYFRLVCLTSYSGSADYLDIGKWLINFSNSVSYSTNYGSTWLNTSSTVSNESVALSPSGQYALSTNSVAPFARLTLDNTNVDAQGVLGAPTVIGTSFSYDTNKVVGTHSINFANTAGATSGVTYLNYTVPAALNTPSALTMSCWVYLTSYPVVPSNAVSPIAFTNGATSGTVVSGAFIYLRSGEAGIGFNVNGGASQYAASAISIPLNTWIHTCATYNGSTMIFYVNGIATSTVNSAGRLTLNNGSSNTNLFIGTVAHNAYAFAGNVDDVRVYTSALNADEINGLFRNPALTQTIAVSSSYLPITSYAEPILPGITANVVDTAVSQTGQYMVAVTSSTTNNVYYSTDFGATFTALTIGSSAMVSCSISYDGTYLTVTNATTTYTLNKNTRGFALAIGNQAGRINQGLNAIAIGDKAGQTNQSANSIVLNATGNALDAVVPGFYVAPIGTTTSSSATSFSLLGYGTDNQVTQTNLTVLSNGNVGIGTSNPAVQLHIIGSARIGTTTNSTDISTNSTSGTVQINSPIASFNSYNAGYPPNINTVVRNSIGAYFGVRDGVVSRGCAIDFEDVNTNGSYPTEIRGGQIRFYTCGIVGQGVNASPRMIIDTGGNLVLNLMSAIYMYYITNTNNAGFITNGGGDLSIFTGTSGVANRLTVQYNGYVNIAILNTNGTVISTGGIGQLAVSSDRRIKENIEYLSDTQQGLASILNLKPATYRLIGQSDTYLGFIAQDLEQDIPLAVDGKKYEWQWEEEDGKPKFDANGDIVYKLDADGNRIIRPRGVMDRAIIATQTLAIQELSKQNAALTQKLDSLLASHAALLAWAQTQGFSGTF